MPEKETEDSISTLIIRLFGILAFTISKILFLALIFRWWIEPESRDINSLFLMVATIYIMVIGMWYYQSRK